MWLREGDKNSKFFHVKFSSKWRKNSLITLKNEVGLWLEGDQLNAHIVDYFQTLFSTNTEKGPINFLSNMGWRITNAMNEYLAHDFTA